MLSRRCCVALLVLALGACSRSPAGQQQSPDGTPAGAVEAPGAVRLEGTVIAPTEAEQGRGRKVFRGVLLRQDDGTEWVISEEAGTPLHAMDGRRVRVEGTAYEPEGQALVLRHLRVGVLTIANLKEDAPLVEVRGEERLEGKFEWFTYPEGTKLAGEKTILFVAAGGEKFHVAHTPLRDGREEALLGRALTVTGFRVEPSRMVARPGGPYLWIKDIEEGN